MDYTVRLDDGQPYTNGADARLFHDVASATFAWRLILDKPDAETRAQAEAILRAIRKIDADSIPF